MILLFPLEEATAVCCALKYYISRRMIKPFLHPMRVMNPWSEGRGQHKSRVCHRVPELYPVSPVLCTWPLFCKIVLRLRRVMPGGWKEILVSNHFSVRGSNVRKKDGLNRYSAALKGAEVEELRVVRALEIECG